MDGTDGATLLALIQQQQVNSNYIWTMTATALVLFMQVGFLFVEAGMVRSKNSINVAQKNISDFLISVSTFYLVGFGIMFGTSWGGWFGTDHFAMNASSDWNYMFLLFQAVFVGTAATIVSGAVAERMVFPAYITIAFVTSLLIYPVFGHLAWGNLLIGDNPAYLADKGFIDFAGSTVVHATGAWVGLAGIIILGPRIGKFNADGSPNTIQGHSYVLAAAGAIILWVGWIGFNGGSTNSGSPEFARIVVNTLLAATFGGTMSVILGRLTDHLHIPHRPINGSLAGLVGITAGCEAVLPLGAVFIGGTCGLLVVGAERLLERVFKLDDVVGAVSVHGVCGAAGTLMVAFYAMPDKLMAASRWGQFMVQLEGVAINFVWAFGTAFCAFKLMDVVSGIRVPEQDELLGLNSTEHGATLGTGALQREIDVMTRGKTDLTRRLDESTGDEAAEIAMLVNPFIARVHDLVVGIKSYADVLRDSSGELEALSAGFAEASQDTSSLSSELGSTTRDASARARASSDLTTGIRESAAEIARNAQDMSDEVTAVSEAVDGLTASIEKISGNADETYNITQQANSLTQKVNETVDVLSSASQEASEVVEIIQGIAFQSNILSVNAQIEAARAGSAGKGFSVVAREVGQLSQETSRAAETVQSRIRHMQDQSGNAKDTIATITRMMEQIHMSVTGINTSVSEQQSATRKISHMVARASGNTGEVATSIQNVAANTATVAENTSSNTRALGKANQLAGSLRAKAEISSENAGTVFGSSRKIAEMSRDLAQSVDQFKTAAPDSGTRQTSAIDAWDQDALDDSLPDARNETGS